MKNFYRLSRRGRIRRLRALVLAALGKYDLPVARVRVMTIETNGIFRVDTTEGNRYVLRVADPSGGHALEQTRAELAWLAAIRRETEIGVPEPIPARGGDLSITVQVSGVPEPRNCTLFSWVPGVDLATRLHAANIERLGAITAQLHRHAGTFTLTEGQRVRTYDRVFLYHDPSFELDEPVVLFDPEQSSILTGEERKLLVRVRDRVQATIDGLFARGVPPRLLHGDLHQWNVKVEGKRLYVLDFEDAHWGHPVQDVATTFYYFDRDQFEPFLEAYRRGYERHAEWPDADVPVLDTLNAGRDLMMLNFVFALQDEDSTDKLPERVQRIVGRLREFDQTGARP